MIYWKKVFIDFPKNAVVGRGWWVTYGQAFSSKLCVFLLLAYCKSVLLVHLHLTFIARLIRTDSSVSLLLSLRQVRVFTFHVDIAEEMIVKRKGDFRDYYTCISVTTTLVF